MKIGLLLNLILYGMQIMMDSKASMTLGYSYSKKKKKKFRFFFLFLFIFVFFFFFYFFKRPFGGWTSPTLHQFKGTTDICGASVDESWFP